MVHLQKLQGLALFHNNISGSIPDNIYELHNLKGLLSHNLITGAIPDCMGNITTLSHLPREFGNLKVATLIDLSVNQFSSSIPTTIGDFKSLINLSLAHNTLQGFILDSMGLCGDPVYGLPPCHTIGNGRHKGRKVMLGILFALSGTIALIIVAIALACAVKRYRRKILGKSITDFAPGTTLPRISYYELMRAAEGYSESHLLGSGSFGSV
ncbi:Hypothetical predicted protein [Olea europaea subsp. europaea]|uniref:Uncharacterized protein n=1 Tax=Olea europaea subsp. europaea TaxID=158383 RepID=A0A8S0VB15_OLEEU|nr:Hypothetical predicted protein [Olea europaea subsp. europaea]